MEVWDNHPIPSPAFGIGGLTPGLMSNTKHITTMENNVIYSNEKTLQQLMMQQNASVNITKQMPGYKRRAFSCGSIKGFVAESLSDALASGTANKENIRYVEISRDGQPAVPCLMLVSKNVEFTFEL